MSHLSSILASGGLGARRRIRALARPSRAVLAARRAASWLRTRVPALSLIGVPAYAIGAVARWLYVLHLHHPRNHIYGDAMPIAELAELLTDPKAHQEFFHTVWPPGASAVLALNLLFDSTLGSAAVCQFALSLAVPLLIAHAAHVAYGRRAAWIALAMGALHFGFVHYSGLFFSEGLGHFAATVAIWGSVVALAPVARSTGPPSAGLTPQASSRWLVAAGAVAGLAWGLAFSFRSNALPVAVFAACWLSVRWARRKRWRAFLAIAGGAFGLLLVFAPLAMRCTQLVGHFCPGACNGPMNVALGHAPDVAGLHFVGVPGDTGGSSSWWPPALGQYAYHGTADVSGSIYDTSRVLSWVKDRFVHDPFEFVFVSLGNALELLGPTMWPEDYEPLPRRYARILDQVLLLGVLIPGMAMWGLNIRRMFQRRDIGCIEAFLTSTILGIFLVSAFSLGEARYRVPFDAAFVLLAARAFAGKDSAPDPECRWPRRSLAAAVAALFVAASLVVATAHPATRLAARLSAVLPASASSPSGVARTVPASALAVRRPDGAPWDAEGNFRFRCAADCPELRIDLGGEHRATSIEVSADHNDRYAVVFRREGRDVGRLAWGVFEGADGLRVVQRRVPLSAIAAGYDTLAIRPLYGDGKYSVGHVLLIDRR